MGTPDMTLSPYESEIITVIVGTGDETRKFYIHKDVACEASPFFSSCLAMKHFPEGRTNTVLLPEDNPEAFGVVLAYMYDFGARLHPTQEITAKTWLLAYILADKLCMKEAFIPLMDENMASTNPNFVFSTTFRQIASDFPGCAVANYLIAQVAWDFAYWGYDCHCACEGREDGTACDWCELVLSGGQIMLRILKMVKNVENGGIEPYQRGAEYWVNQARELQSEDGGKALVRIGPNIECHLSPRIRAKGGEQV